MAHGLEAIDWAAPWLAPWRGLGEGLAQQEGAGQSVAQVLNTASGAPVQFVPQAALPEGAAYEQHIFETRSVPTRDGLHDFFNGLCWLHFPLAKQRLNQLQAEQIAHSGIGAVRGPVRDALTVFDENAALLLAPEPLWEALLAKDWQTLFLRQRPLWAQATLLLFGHALLEKLVFPRKPITAHVFIARAASNSIADLDAWLAQTLTAEGLARKPFAPLPVLGVPGWWVANEEPGFYDDASVFRPPRTASERGARNLPLGRPKGSGPLGGQRR